MDKEIKKHIKGLLNTNHFTTFELVEMFKTTYSQIYFIKRKDIEGNDYAEYLFDKNNNLDAEIKRLKSIQARTPMYVSHSNYMNEMFILITDNLKLAVETKHELSEKAKQQFQKQLEKEMQERVSELKRVEEERLKRVEEEKEEKRLERVTAKQNKKILSLKEKPKVYQYTLNGELVGVYETTKEAADKTNVFANYICKVILNQRKKAGGFIWKRF